MGHTDLISIVDDDEAVRQAIDGLLRSVGLRARTFASGEEFLRSGHLGTTGCLILDLRMPKMDGWELQQRLAGGGHRVPVIVLTAHADDAGQARARDAGAVAVLAKPFDADVLLGAVETALGGEA